MRAEHVYIDGCAARTWAWHATTCLVEPTHCSSSLAAHHRVSGLCPPFVVFAHSSSELISAGRFSPKRIVFARSSSEPIAAGRFPPKRIVFCPLLAEAHRRPAASHRSVSFIVPGSLFLIVPNRYRGRSPRFSRPLFPFLHIVCTNTRGLKINY